VSREEPADDQRNGHQLQILHDCEDLWCGRGLELVDVVSTDWGVNTDGTASKAVWASFAIG
jgi:hypothetical protein